MEGRGSREGGEGGLKNEDGPRRDGRGESYVKINRLPPSRFSVPLLIIDTSAYALSLFVRLPRDLGPADSVTEARDSLPALSFSLSSLAKHVVLSRKNKI